MIKLFGFFIVALRNKNLNKNKLVQVQHIGLIRFQDVALLNVATTFLIIVGTSPLLLQSRTLCWLDRMGFKLQTAK